MSVNKWTKANRLTEVITQTISSEKVGRFPMFKKERLVDFGTEFEQLDDDDPIWMVTTTSRTGLDKEGTGFSFYTTEEKAEEAVRSMPVGTITGDGFGWPMRFKEMFGNTTFNTVKGSSDPRSLLSHIFINLAEDAVHYKCYEALSKAGVISEKNFMISQHVIDWLGDEHVKWMKAEFDENWSVVGELEFCINHFPDSSLATLSAKLFCAYFVTHDDFSVGYYTKEIEAIDGGTENAALQSTELRKKAGLAGGQASRKRKLANLEIFMEEIEALSGAVGLINEKLILQQAKEAALTRCQTMPHSQKTLEDYETYLRSEEPFKSRYRAVFRKNA